MSRKADKDMAEPRLVRVLLELAQFGPKMTAFERCEKLGETKAAYLEIYPEAGTSGKGPHSSGFCTYVAKKEATSKRGINFAISIYDSLTPDSRSRLRGASEGIKQAWLKALSDLPEEAQARALDRIDQGRATTLKEAVAQEVGQATCNARGGSPNLRDVPTLVLLDELRARALSGTGVQHE